MLKRRKVMQRLLICFLFVGSIYACSPVGKENRIKILFEKANKKLAQESYDDAIAFYDQILEMNHDLPQVYQNRGVAYFETGHLVLALADYNHVLKSEPENYAIYFNRARTYLDLGRNESCRSDVDFLKKQFPDTALVYFIEGLLFHQMDENENALVSFNQSLTLEEGNSETLANRGMVYYAMGQYEKADQDLMASLKIDANNVYAVNALALVKAEQGGLVAADSLINLALTDQPDQPIFLNNRGYINILRNEFQQAETDILSSLRLDDKNAWAHQNLGILHSAKGNNKEAIMSLQEALTINSKLKKAKHHLVKAYIAIGNTDAACEILADNPTLKEQFADFKNCK